MRSILEEFAEGNISPESLMFKRHSGYGKAMDTVAKTEETLLERLNDDEEKLLAAYTGAQMRLNQLTAVRNLIYGYKLGLLMTTEAFLTSEDLLS